jgi:hypothetical protein
MKRGSSIRFSMDEPEVLRERTSGGKGVVDGKAGDANFVSWDRGESKTASKVSFKGPMPLNTERDSVAGRGFNRSESGIMSPGVRGSQRSVSFREPDPGTGSKSLRESQAKIETPSADATAALVSDWADKTLSSIVAAVNVREDPYGLQVWVRELRKDIVDKVVKQANPSVTRDFIDDVLKDCSKLCMQHDWADACLDAIVSKIATKSVRRSSLTVAGPMILDEGVRSEFGDGHRVVHTRDSQDASIELGQ